MTNPNTQKQQLDELKEACKNEKDALQKLQNKPEIDSKTKDALRQLTNVSTFDQAQKACKTLEQDRKIQLPADVKEAVSSIAKAQPQASTANAPQYNKAAAQQGGAPNRSSSNPSSSNSSNRPQGGKQQR